MFCSALACTRPRCLACWNLRLETCVLELAFWKRARFVTLFWKRTTPEICLVCHILTASKGPMNISYLGKGEGKAKG